jgi:hypothetical protein
MELKQQKRHEKEINEEEEEEEEDDEKEQEPDEQDEDQEEQEETKSNISAINKAVRLLYVKKYNRSDESIATNSNNDCKETKNEIVEKLNNSSDQFEITMIESDAQDYSQKTNTNSNEHDFNQTETIIDYEKLKSEKKAAMIAESRLRAKQFDAEKLRPFFIEYKDEPHEITDYDVCSNILLLVFVLLGLVLVFLCGLGIAFSNVL